MGNSNPGPSEPAAKRTPETSPSRVQRLHIGRENQVHTYAITRSANGQQSGCWLGLGAAAARESNGSGDGISGSKCSAASSRWAVAFSHLREPSRFGLDADQLPR